MKDKKKNIILYIVLGVVVLLAAAAVFIMFTMKPAEPGVKDHISNGKAFAESGDYEKALAAYGMALDIEPDNIQIYLAMADIYDRMEDKNSLEGVYSKTISIVENDIETSGNIPEGAADIYYRYADFLMDSGREEDTYRLLLKADNRIEGLLKNYRDDFFEKAAAFEYYGEKAVLTGDGQIYFGGYPCDEIEPDSLPVAVKAGEFTDDRLTVGQYTYIRISDGSGAYRYYKYENILWDIVSEGEDGYLVISHDIVDAVPYSEKYEDVVWKDSYARQWLNDDFYNAAFTDEQKKCVLSMYVETPINIMYGTGSGEPVEDNVTIMSMDDVLSTEYGYDGDVYSIYEERAAGPTMYAVNNGAIVEENGNGRWWLRTRGSNAVMETYISESGAVACGGEMVNAAGIGVRPVIVISKDAVEK